MRKHGYYDPLEALMYRSQIATQNEHRELKMANKLLGDYVELMLPYEGKSIGDIPEDVMQKANAIFDKRKVHLRNCKRYESQWRKAYKQIDELSQNELEKALGGTEKGAGE